MIRHTSQLQQAVRPGTSLIPTILFLVAASVALAVVHATTAQAQGGQDSQERLTSADTASVQSSAPDTPDLPFGNAVFVGGVDLEWNDVPGADSYDVQLFHNGKWTDLPGDGIEIAFYGAGAIVSELDPESTLWFRLRARNTHGYSDWSGWNQMNSTDQSASGRRARPDNVAASGAPTINGTAQIGEVLTADTTDIEDGNGLDRVQFRFQWVSDDGNVDTDISGATDSTYTLVAADGGRTIKVRVAFRDRGGYAESLTSGETAPVAAASNNPAIGQPAIAGTVQVGETLMANASGITDADGLTNTSYGYQWIANDGTADADIAGATDTKYTLVAADEGKTIKVRVSFTDDAGNDESLTSAATDVVKARPNTPATGQPAIKGTVQVGETLTVDASGIADADGLTNVSYSYQWVANDGTSDTDITGATSPRYTLVAADEGAIIKVRVTFTDDSGNDESLTSAATDSVKARPNSPATGAPTISGTAHVGETLTANTSGIADTDGLTDASYSYQWVRDDGASDTDITHATSSSYTLVDVDEGKTVKVRVTFTDDAGNEESLTSSSTGWVAAAGPSDPPAAPTGLTAAPSHDRVVLRWDDSLDETITGYVILRRNRATTGAGEFTELVANTGSATTTYTDGEVESGASYTYRVRAINEFGVSELSRWVRADTPAAPIPAAPTGLTVAPSHDRVVLRWDDPLDETITGYVILRRNRANTGVGEFTELVADTGSATTTYTDSEVESGASYTYKVGAINEYGVSELSRWARADTPEANSPATGAPTISGTVEVGETLTSDISGIEDADGLENAVFSYQWVRYDGASDTDITHATSSSYTLAGSDQGKTIKVRVSFTDDAGSEESLTSPATAQVAARPNSPATGALTVIGTARVGETVRAITTAISDDDGLTNVSYTYQWVRHDGADDADITGATDSSYTLVDEDAGATIKVRVSFTDDAANDESLTSQATATVAPRLPLTEDDIPPTISSIAITSDPDDDEEAYYHANTSPGFTLYDQGVYGLGENVTVTVTFSEGVTVTGSPRLEVNVGGMARSATYNGSSSGTVAFRYTVATGDSDTDGISIGANKLTLNGGTIKDAADNDADLSHSALSAQSNHKVDGVRPTVSSTSFASNSFGTDGVYTTGEFMHVLADFSEDVIIIGKPGGALGVTLSGNPQIAVDVGGTTKQATWTPVPVNVWRGDSWLFLYTVQVGDLDVNGATVGANSLSLNGGSIKDPAGNNAILTHSSAGPDSIVVDADPATISSISFTSDPGSDDTYGVGDRIEATVTFSESVRIPRLYCGTGICMPRLELDIGGVARFARTPETSTMTGTSIVFSYTVLDGDNDANGVSIGANRLTGGRIEDNVGPYGGEYANTSHGAVADDSRHKVATSSSPPKSNDATLSVLSLSDVDFGIFASSTISYRASVGYEVSETTVSATANHSGASYVVKKNGRLGHDGLFSLDAGAANLIVVSVTAEDGTTVRNYTVTVSRARPALELWTDASLSSLNLSGVDFGTFSSSTLSYTANVANSVSETTVSATVNRSLAIYQVKLDGLIDYDHIVSLGVGTNVITVQVVAEDLRTTRTYTVTVNRAAAPTAPVPAAPTGLTAASSHDRVVLSWDDPLDESITGYLILRRNGANTGVGEFTELVADTGSATTTYTDSEVESGASYTYKVGAINRYGVSEISHWARADTPEANIPATGAPTISGTAEVGGTLTADVSGIVDSDGLDNATFSFQWVRNDGVDDTDITHATGSSYTLVDADEGKTIKVRVSFTDDGGHEESLISETTDTVSYAIQQQSANSPATGAPTIIGTAQVGETLTVDMSGIDDADGLTGVVYSYQWLADDVDIEDAADSTYEVSDDVGKAIKVRVTFTDNANNEETLTSEATAAVTARPNRPAKGNPHISGTAREGETLTASTSGIADEDGLRNPTYSYQWIRSDGGTDTDIAGETASTYTVSAADLGKTIKVRVSFSDDQDNHETLTSVATAVVTARPNTPATGLPTISGTVQVGERLMAGTSGIADADGLTGVSYGYQWLADGADITDAIGSTYTLVDADKGRAIKVRVSFTDDAGNEESRTSTATVAVAPPVAPPGAPGNLTASARPDGTVSLSWEAPGDGPVNSYQILRKRPDQGESRLVVLVEDTASTSTEFVDSDVTLGKQHIYRVKAINSAGVGPRSDAVRITPTREDDPGPNRPASGAPRILGEPQVGQTLSVDTSAIADPDGLTNPGYRYQWSVTDLGVELAIAGATGSTYTVSDIDLGLYIKVRITLTDDRGNMETRTSELTGVVH